MGRFLKTVFLLNILFSAHFSFADETKSGAPDTLRYTVAPTPENYNCEPLKPGQSTTVSQPWYDSPTRVEREYKLTRDPKNPSRYIATVNIAFKPTLGRHDETRGLLSGNYRVSPNDIDPGKSTYEAAKDTLDGEVMAQYNNQTKACFKKMEGKLKSPEGTTIDFKLANHEESKEITPVPVSVERADHRSHSRAWEGDIDCPTIIHEVLHLMGLCDGYHERNKVDRNHVEDSDKRINITKFNCRSLEPESSVMRDQGHLEGTVEVYICPGTTGEKKNSAPPTKCSDGSRPFLNVVSKPTLDAWAAGFKQYTYYYQEIQGVPNLQSAHARFITQPFCDSKNSLYIKCSKNAYRTDAIEGCANVPPECKNGDYLK